MSNESVGGLVMRSSRAPVCALALVTGVVGLVALLGAAAPAGAAEGDGEVRFADSAIQTVEDHGQMRVIVERVDLPVSALVVNYRTEGGTAIAGSDFVEMTGRMVFEVGVRSQAFVVPLRDDEVPEETEHLTLHLSTSSGRSISALMAILDDDEVVSEVPDAGDAGPGTGSAAGSSARARTASASASASPAAAPQPPPQVRRRMVVTSPRKRVALRQSPVTPFELRPAPPESAAGVAGLGQGGGPTRVDPLLALAAGLLMARVGAEVWFRSRTSQD